MILDEIAAATRRRVAARKMLRSQAEMEAAAYSCGGCGPDRFENAISSPGLSFICEVKRASPSKGVISSDFPYINIAKEYEAAGAAAVSVLTEPDFFMGSDDYLREIAKTVSIPALRKDFTVDVYQIYEAKTLGASAVLLICALLDENTLSAFIETTYALGMSALVEAHDEREIEAALRCGARIIGVNNRDLRTFSVDLGASLRLRPLVPGNVPFVAESGITSADDVKALVEGGVDAALIGEAVMRAGDKAAFLRKMRGEG